ncbi:MAG: hypothetical protein C0507_17025 [Cyanobacteria bacterium PR.3.49]|nr:hypothetical protein [Cyanobacteria bacterium PR.3.49]
MNQMLKQHHIRLQDLRSFLRGYGTNKPQTPEEWAANESKLFTPGMLIFCLDSIAAPPGLAQFSKKDAATDGETYRVKDMSVVVSMTDGKPLAVNITASAFDMRFLDQLMMEKARKAILDGRDFLYVAASTPAPLDLQQSQVLETLATSQYTQGGSRRTLASGEAGSQEPAQALLGALGAPITSGAPGKHVLDIGNVCHMLFGPEGRQEDKNRVLMKSCFNPIAGDPTLTVNEGQSAEAPAQMQYEDVTQPQAAPAAPPQAGDSGSGWTDPTQWVEPQVPTDELPEAWQAPSQEIPFPNQPAQWTQPGGMDQAAASFLNPDAPVQVPDSSITDSSETGMPRPAPLGSPRQSMTGFKALEDTGTFRKFDNAPSGSNQAAPQADMHQAAAAAFAAAAADNETAAAPAPATEPPAQDAQPWMPVGTPQAQPFLPPPAKAGAPQQIRPQAIRPQTGQDPVSFQVETGIYQQFGAPPIKPAEPAQAAEAVPAAAVEPAAEVPAAIAPEFAEAPQAEAFAAPEPQTAPIPEPAAVHPAQSEVPAEPEAPAVDESNLSLFERLNLKLSKVKTEGTPQAPVTAPPVPSQSMNQPSEPAELFGWETPEDIPSPAEPAFQSPAQQVDEWQSWDEPVAAAEPVAPPQEAALADALSGLMGNQASYEEPAAAYASSYTPEDFASQAPAPTPSYESDSQFGTPADTPPGWAEFQESFQDTAAPSAQPAVPEVASLPAEDGGWVEPEIPELPAQAVEAVQEVPAAEIAAVGELPPAAPEAPAVAVPAPPAPPAPVLAPPPAISASNPFLTPPPLPPPPVQEIAPPPAEEPIGEVAAEIAATAEVVEAPAAEVPQEAAAVEEVAAAVETPAVEEPPAAPEPPPAPRAPRKPTAEEQAAVAAEMASFQKKLEQQLAKAAKKLNSRVEDIKAQLTAEMERLASQSEESDKQSEASLADVGTRFTKQLENVTEDVRLKISDASANGRYTIKQLLTTSQSQIEEERNLRYEALREASKQFRIDTEALARSLEKEMQDTVNKRTTEVAQMVDAVIGKLKEAGDAFVAMVEMRFERFKDRMGEETNTVTALLDRSVNSMMDELEGTNDKSMDKLKSAKNDFEQTINYQVRTAELTLSRKTRQHLTLTLLPKLNERKQILRAMSTEMSNRFAEESTMQVNAQMTGLEASLNAAKGQLHNLVTECLSNIDSVGRNQQAGLEEIFKDASAYIEKCTNEVTATLTSTEKQIQETETFSKKLAETSSVDADPQLTEVRNTAHTKVLQIKQQATSGLITTLDSGCDRLDQISQQAQQDLTNLRTQYSQGARQASDNGLASMRDAIQEALAAIQAAREKYME